MINTTSTAKNRQMKYVRKHSRTSLDPFQIFCIEKRDEFLDKSCKIRISDVTSILGKIWRGMSIIEKSYYYTISRELNKVVSLHKRKKAGSKDDNHHLMDRINDTIHVESFLDLHIPKICIVERINSYDDVAELSLKVTSDQLKE